MDRELSPYDQQPDGWMKWREEHFPRQYMASRLDGEKQHLFRR
jgi:hypothetical protein